MTLDSEPQRANLLACIKATANGVRMEATDESLALHLMLVQLRQDIETATVTVPAEGSGTEMPKGDT